MKRLPILTLCAIVPLLAGCGSGSGSGLTPYSKVYPLATSLHLYDPADNWVYNVAVTYPGGASSGFDLRSARFGTIGDSGYLILTDAPSYDTGLTPEATDYYYNQDIASRDLSLTFTFSALRPPPLVVLPGAWTAGYSFSNQITGADGSIVDVRLNVDGPEMVSVPAGKFQTWKCEQTQSIEGDWVTTGTYWYAPQLGTYVRAAFSTTFSRGSVSGQTYNYAFNLTSTNIPLE